MATIDVLRVATDYDRAIRRKNSHTTAENDIRASFHFSANTVFMTRRKTTMYIEDELLTATKVAAARAHKHELSAATEY